MKTSGEKYDKIVNYPTLESFEKQCFYLYKLMVFKWNKIKQYDNIHIFIFVT